MTISLENTRVQAQNIDRTTFQDSATEQQVGQTINGAPIYERTYTGTVTFSGHSRDTVLTMTGIYPISIDGYIEMPVSSSTTFKLLPNSMYTDGTGAITARSWLYSTGAGFLLSALTTNPGSGNYYITIRYTKTAG